MLLDRAALSGLNVVFRAGPNQAFQGGCIQLYDEAYDCFIVSSGPSNAQYQAIQFKQFTVEQDAGQIVLRVPKCVHTALPQPYQDLCNEGIQRLHSEEAGASSRASSGMAQASNHQLSNVLSRQLSGLIGRCFSQTDDGFEPAAPLQQAPAAAHNAAGSNTAATKQQPLHVQVHRPSRHSTDSAHDDSSYWGSPVKHDNSAGNTATCSLAATTAEMVPPCSTAPSSTTTCHQQQHSSTTATSSIPGPAAQEQPAEAACTPPAPVAAAPATQAVSFSSFQEISRMISHSEDSSPLARPSSIKTSMPPGLAARLLDEQASWGTPQENSPWGTPREQQLGSNATNTPTSGSVEQQGSNPGHHFSGPAVHKLMFGGEQLHSRLEAAVSGKQLAEHLEQQPISLPAAAAALPADVLGVSKAAPAKPAAAPAAGELEPAAAVAAAVAAVDAAAAETEADSFGDLDFTIPVAMDVQPRPHSRGSSRIREVYRASNTSASNTGMVVDVPQPLTSRHTGLMRSPGRSLPAPSDPGYMGTASAFSHAASMSAAQVSASVGGAAGFEQRRTATNIGPGLGSFGGSHAASRRMSRNASSRLNADQDWALLGPDGQLLQQQLAAMQVPQQRVSVGQVLHAPGVGSRRTSRTLSGRLALDQDAAAVLMEQLDDSEPDVLSRPVAPAAPGLDTIVSRRQSTSNGRGTPDSDGFGFSEFEGLEPLVPPEEAAAAALTEAAAAAAAAAAATDGGAADGMNSSSSSSVGALHHHRVHRRSARSLGVPPPVNMGHRPSMRLSDQDPGHHGLAALPAMTAAAVAAAAAARAHTSAAPGLPGPRIVGYDVVSTPLPEEEDAVGMEAEGPAADSSSTTAPAAAAAAAGTPVRLGSRTNSTGAAAAGSPRQSATGGSSTRAASGSLDGSNRSSKRSIPSIFQAAAAVAAAAEAAAAAAVGYALGGRDRTSGEQQALDKAAQGAEADGKVQAAAAAMEQLEDPEQLQESAFAAPSSLKQRLGGGGEGLGSVDSFTCPPFMPLAGSITVTGSRSGLSIAASNTSSAVSSSNGSQPGPSAVSGSGDTTMAAEPAVADASLGQAVEAGLAGTPAFRGHAYAMAAATAAGAIAADGEPHATGVYGSPAANIGSFIAAAAAGSPSAATAALLRRQQLLSSEGSEWGSGALGSHLHLSTSGIDSPTGSAVFRLGGNSPHPLDTCDSAGGRASVAPGELTAALEFLAVQSGCGTGGSKPIGIGASRMAREAAAAAGHAGSLTNQGVSLPAGSGCSNGPVGAAALLLGAQGAAVLNKGLAAGLSEITPAADDEEPGGGMISAKYPSDSGNNPAAAAVFFRLAGGLAPGDTTTATAQQGAGDMALQRSSSSDGGAAISKVLGKIAVGKAPLLPKPAEQSSSSSTLSRQAAAGSGGAAASRGSDACSNISSEAAPPSYVESVGGDADDEQSPYGHHAAVSSRRVWPAQYAAETEAAAAASADDNASIRQSAALGRTSHTAGLAASQWQEQQQVVGEDAGSPERPSTGLVRRTPHTSRTPSQSLPPGMRPSLEGLGLLGGRSFHDEYCDELPLMRGTVTSVAEQEAGAAVFDARSQVGRVVLHAFLTLSAQWFDISALVVLGPQLAGAMLAPGTPQLQQVRNLFGIFALGHVLWLLGCFLWPWRAAALGRKGLLAWTLGLSGLCTALMACMPSYAEAGATGIGIITLLRIVSGAAVGNTAPAALVYLTEHAPQCPSLHASLVPASMAAGACAASSLALLLSWVMSPAVLAASGWRVVLVMSLLGNAVTGWLRGYVLQEPEGKMQVAELLDRSNAHVGTILRHHAPQVLLAVLLQAFAVSGLYLLAAWLPSYFMQLAGMTPSTALLMHTFNMAALTGSMPLGGLLADEWERTPVLLATCVTAVGFGYPAWLLFSLGVAEMMWFAQCILCVLVGLHWGALTGALADLFPLGMRCSAMAVAHMVPMMALGATAPLMAVGFIAQSGSLAAPALVSIIMAVVTAAAVSWQSWRTAARGLQF